MILDLPSQEIVYHYTNFDSLESILKTKVLRLSHIACLNDISEGYYGLKEIFQDIKAKVPKLNNTSLDDFKKYIEAPMKEHGFCVGSFCADEGNSLNQWRAYGNNGYGVAVGFSLDSLKALCEQNKYAIGSCEYEFKLDFYKRNRDKIRSLYNGENTEVIDRFVLAVNAIFLKHPDYKEEKECRIVASGTYPKNYSKVADRLISYHELFLGDDYSSWLKKVVIGPSHQQFSIGRAIETIFQQLQIDLKVSYSETPYRGIKYYN